MLYPLTLGWPLTQSPFMSLKKNWGDTDWRSRLEGNWLHCWTQRVLTSSTNSKRQPVTSSFPQGSTLGPTLFIILINSLDNGTECTLSKLVNGIKLEGAINALESRATFKYSLMGWRNGLRGTFRSSTKATVKPSIWFGITLCNGIDWLANRFADKELENPLNVN